MVHPMMPYALVPVYLACAWAWWLRVGRDQTLLQSLLLPLFVVPTLLPTPLLEPRYFLIPYILLRSQVRVPFRNVVLEGAWYGVMNAVTMGCSCIDHERALVDLCGSHGVHTRVNRV